MLISESYRELNKQLHATNPHYGANGSRHAKIVQDVAFKNECRNILDYGCGRGSLKRELSMMDVREYDPAILGKDRVPSPADLVVCTDVLEHVEPEALEAVLSDIYRCSRLAVVLTVHTGPAKKILADGRNAHLTQEPYTWWLPRLWARWCMQKFIGAKNGFLFIGVSN